MNSGYNLPISLGHHGLGLSSGGLYWVVMGWSIWRRASLLFSSVKEEDSPRLGAYLHLPHEEELDHHGEEISHWPFPITVLVPHSFEYSFHIVIVLGLDVK